jgi:hypothetical protein
VKEWTTIRGYLLGGPQSVELDGQVHERVAALEAFDRVLRVIESAMRAADEWAAYERVPDFALESAKETAGDRWQEASNALDDAVKALRGYANGDDHRAIESSGHRSYFAREITRLKIWLDKRDSERWAERNRERLERQRASMTPMPPEYYATIEAERATSATIFHGGAVEYPAASRPALAASVNAYVGAEAAAHIRQPGALVPVFAQPPTDELSRVCADNDLLRDENVELRRRVEHCCCAQQQSEVAPCES